MAAFRAFLAAIIAVVGVYTAIVIGEHGMGLFPIFFGDMAKMNWPGQFNLDFMCFLLMSGLWIAWRQNFSPLGLLLGAIGVVGGAPYLSIYLLVASAQVKGNVAALLLGPTRAQEAV